MNGVVAIQLLMIFALLMGVRLLICVDIGNKRITEISAEANLLIEQDKPWCHLLDEFESPLDMKNLFDLTKWTYHDFYGDKK